jgi:N-methylhydantoinase A
VGFVIGIDTGGTFTDCVVIDADGRIVTAKASSTPGDFSEAA